MFHKLYEKKPEIILLNNKRKIKLKNIEYLGICFFCFGCVLL